uniref:Uncharacterized protein n=1 Tax=Panagrolaimus sp. PS1159 TaxID=55785 RepID=A0AC35FLF1_9BILA
MIPVVLSLNDISNESSPSHDITEKDVKDFMTEFENLQSRGETLFNVVEAVAEYSMKCAEKSGPIGILMTKAAKALIDPKSSELAAIQLLSKFLLNATVDIYGEIGMISPQLHEIGDMAGWTPYVTKVGFYLRPTIDMILAVTWNNNSIFF